MLLRAVDILKRAAPHSPDLLRALRHLGDIRVAQKRDADAAQYFETAIALYEAGGEEREGVYNDVAQVYDRLAGIYAASGRTAEAKPLFHQAIRLCRKAPVPDFVEMATAMNNLGLIYADERIYASAEKLYREAIEVLEQTGHPDRNCLAATLHNLAAVYSLQGHYRQARPLLERAVNLWEQAPGRSPELALALSHYARLLRKMHQTSEAQQAEARSHALRGANALVGSPD